jgi:hypothetical protein
LLYDSVCKAGIGTEGARMELQAAEIVFEAIALGLVVYGIVRVFVD